jgi:hypothetical protein
MNQEKWINLYHRAIHNRSVKKNNFKLELD